eukprot:3941638-Rhodomonas_salina.3
MDDIFSPTPATHRHDDNMLSSISRPALHNIFVATLLSHALTVRSRVGVRVGARGSAGGGQRLAALAAGVPVQDVEVVDRPRQKEGEGACVGRGCIGSAAAGDAVDGPRGPAADPRGL